MVGAVFLRPAAFLRGNSLLRAMLAAMLAAAALVLASPAAAQTTVRADWTNLNKSSLQVVNNGDVLTAGPNTVTVNTRINRDGDANDAGFTNYYSTGMLSYYSGQFGNDVGPLLYSMDHTIFDVGDYFETTYTLNTGVTNLAFNVLNVDRLISSPTFMHDAVTIEYDTGTGVWLNIRTNAAFYALGAAVQTTTINGVQGFHGVSYLNGDTNTAGNIAVNFGTTTVKRIRIRYLFGQASPTSDPTGANQYIGLSDLTWQQTGVNVSDLSLTMTQSTATPVSGATASYTLNLTNAGPLAANNVVVRDLLPSGFSFTGATGYGTYDAATGMWTVPTIASGQTRTITLTGTVSAPAGIALTNTAEVYSSPNYDGDSSPNNGVTSEDDRAALTMTVQGTRTAGVAPTLVCPAGSTLFDWDARTWTGGSTSNAYAVTGIGTVSFAITNQGTWMNDGGGGMTPRLQNVTTGGLATPELSLSQSIDFATIDQSSTTTITLPTAVPGFQMRVFDVDYGVNDFADKLTVIGSYNGTPVQPVLTNGTANYVVGNSVIGDQGSANNTNGGNVTITFSQPVDTVTITYGNASTAPINPDGQEIALHDITLCNPQTSVTVSKVSAVVSDPVNGTTNQKAIPGAVMQYCVLITNQGSATITGATGTDTLPTTLTYVPGSMKTGSSCAAATTAEDDDAAGADETDPFGASISGRTITMVANQLGPTAAMAVKYSATIN